MYICCYISHVLKTKLLSIAAFVSSVANFDNLLEKKVLKKYKRCIVSNFDSKMINSKFSIFAKKGKVGKTEETALLTTFTNSRKVIAKRKISRRKGCLASLKNVDSTFFHVFFF